jgi:sulfhydrogenase subunit beta (sulfur reductase)
LRSVETTARAAVLAPEGLTDLVETLRARGYRVLGPQVRDGAIVYDDLTDAADLPTGWTDVQGPGGYRLERRADEKRFGYAVGPHSWKQFLFPPRVKLWQTRLDGTLAIEEAPPPDRPLALIGVRPCELAAIDVQDRVFIRGTFSDRDYAGRREGLFVVAVDCGDPAATCFCTSMGTGPKAGAGYDLALTEVIEGGHRFLAEAATAAGAEVLAELPQQPVADADVDAGRAVIAGAVARMGQAVDTTDLPGLLAGTLEADRWDDVAGRCLGCSNCTLVCPTCFCSTVEDATDLAGQTAERTRTWDSCFSVDHSYIHGGPIRPSGRSRYRQWLTHKFGTWHAQFGTSGCVGCGRCIAWCPVGIDVREELAALRSEDRRAREEAPRGDD